MIIHIQPTSILLSCPPKWWLYYKEENEPDFHKIAVTYEQLKAFLETYGYETNDILALAAFGIDTTHIKHNKHLA
jgi:hypothetical protein